MRGLTHALLAAVADEVARDLADARVRAVHQEGEHRFRFVLERAGTKKELVVDLDPDLPRAHLAEPASAPKSPSPLAHALRNALVGARLLGAAAVSGERALAFTFSLGGLDRTLWFEAFGRQANLYLVDEAGIVRVTPRGEAAEGRGNSVGARFKPVPPRPLDPEEQAAAHPEGPSRAVERLAAESKDARASAARRASVERTLRQALAKARGTVHVLEEMEQRGAGAADLRRRGELLRASFHLLTPGATRVRVPDLRGEGEVDLELDPKRTPGEEIGACFHAAERCERAEAEARARLPAARERVEALAAAEERLAGAATVEDLEALASEAGLGAAGAVSARGSKKGKGAPADPWRTFVSLDGWTIRVGKEARGNDRLTLHEAAPHDLFLHVRGASGSHVLVTTPRGKSVPKETLLDAAELACLYSQRAKAEHNEVDYVERRHVRKPKGTPAGLVELQRASTLRVRRDDARRARLKGAMT